MAAEATVTWKNYWKLQLRSEGHWGAKENNG
jgi:hypothetical protein